MVGHRETWSRGATVIDWQNSPAGAAPRPCDGTPRDASSTRSSNQVLRPRCHGRTAKSATPQPSPCACTPGSARVCTGDATRCDHESCELNVVDNTCRVLWHSLCSARFLVGSFIAMLLGSFVLRNLPCGKSQLTASLGKPAAELCIHTLGSSLLRVRNKRAPVQSL